MAGARRESAVFTVVVTALVLLCAVPMTVIVGLSGAPRATVLAALLAAVPVGPLVACFLWLDRYEPEPRRLLAGGLLWGVFVATAIALLLEGVGGFFGGISDHRMLELGAPLAEEGSKGLFLFLLLWWRRSELDGVLDGLVYAGMVGVGFAFTENILYYGRIFNTLSEESGSDAGLRGAFVLFVIRGLISPFAHPLFTSFTAIGIGVAIRSRSTAVRFLAPIVGYLAAVLAHGLWNGGASWAGGGGFITVYLFLMVPIFIGMVVFALVMRSREGQMIASRLYDYVRFGWLVPQDVPLIATLRGRKALRQNAKRYGPQAEAAAKAFQQNATELAYLRDKIVRQVIGPDALETEKQLLDELRERRPSVPFPPMPAFAQAAPQFQVPPGGPGGPMPGPVRGGQPGGPMPGGPYPGAGQAAPQGGYPPAQPGYPSGQPGYPAGQPGYPPGPTGQQ